MNRMKAYAVYVNTDLTEGKGFRVPEGIYESRYRAEQEAKGRDVQGSDGHVREVALMQVGNEWWGPVQVVRSTREDRAIDERREKRQQALERAKRLGLSDEDIALIRLYPGDRQFSGE